MPLTFHYVFESIKLSRWTINSCLNYPIYYPHGRYQHFSFNYISSFEFEIDFHNASSPKVSHDFKNGTAPFFNSKLVFIFMLSKKHCLVAFYPLIGGKNCLKLNKLILLQVLSLYYKQAQHTTVLFFEFTFYLSK